MGDKNRNPSNKDSYEPLIPSRERKLGLCGLSTNTRYLMAALDREEVQGPAEVIKGIPLKVATPPLLVKRCCRVND